MAMTAAVKDELSRVDVAKPCCRRAEMTALLRFAGDGACCRCLRGRERRRAIL
jgi:DNA-binding transcriptional regulator WhiA